MPSNRREYEFRIDTYTPSTMPMNRLAAYLADLATLLGEHQSVHFVRLSKGSLGVVHKVDYEAEPKVRERIRLAKASDEPNDAGDALRRIDRTLAEDNASGVLIEPGGNRIIEFPGRKRFEQPKYGPFSQPGIVEGIPISIGGVNPIVPVHLQEGPAVHYCLAHRMIALEIAPYLFGEVIRAEGIAKWTRERDGTWTRDQFTIQSFQPVEKTPLRETVDRLREMDAGLRDQEDTLEKLYELRHGKKAAG